MSKSIKEQNDHFRKTREGGRTMMTSGISVLDGTLISEIVDHVRNFEIHHVFNKDNDPYGEHDFGSFTHKGVKIFWKIDYYDKGYKFGSPDPNNPSLTNRVLTIMKASEY